MYFGNETQENSGPVTDANMYPQWTLGETNQSLIHGTSIHGLQMTGTQDHPTLMDGT